MQLVPGSKRMFADERTDPVEGRVGWAPGKSLWIGAVTLAAVVFGPLTFSWDALVLLTATSAVTLCFRAFSRDAPASHPRKLRLSAVARASVRLSGHIGRDGRPDRHGAHPRFSRLGAAPVGMSRLFPPSRGLLARRLVAVALPARADASAQVPAGAAARQRPVLCPRRAHLDALTAPVGRTVLGDRRRKLAGVGHLRAGERVRDGPLAGRAFRPSPRRPELHRRGRGRPGLQRCLRRPREYGRELAQQSSCLSRIRQDGFVSRSDRPRLVAHQDVRGVRSRDEYQDAGESSVQARPAPPGTCWRRLTQPAECVTAVRMTNPFSFRGRLSRLPYALWSVGVFFSQHLAILVMLWMQGI